MGSSYDVIVVGAGHAGVEAAHAAAHAAVATLRVREAGIAFAVRVKLALLYIL